jgi:DnaJ homolog subfamily C member 8
MNLANEGLEAKKKEEEVATRKRKAEEDKTWEGSLVIHSTIFCLGSNSLRRNERTTSGQLA